MDLKIYGWYPFMQFSLTSLVSPFASAAVGPFCPPFETCHGVTLSPDLSQLHVLLETSVSTGRACLFQASVSLGLLQHHPLGIANIALHSSYVSEILGTLHSAGNELLSAWKETTGLLTKKFQFLVNSFPFLVLSRLHVRKANEQDVSLMCCLVSSTLTYFSTVSGAFEGPALQNHEQRG